MEDKEQGTEAPVAGTAPRNEPTPPQGAVRVMEIDYAGDPAVIAREELQAKMEGIPVVKKGAHLGNPPAAGKAPDAKEVLRRMFLGEDQEQATAQPVKAPDHIKKFFKDQGLGDADEWIAEYPRMRKQYVEMEARSKQAEQDLSYLGKLSPEALNVVQMDLDGKDWRTEVASRPKLDYGKGAKEQDVQALDKAYGDGSITEDDWEEYKDRDGDPKVKAFVQAKLDLYHIKYEADKAKAVNYVNDRAALQKQNEEKYAKSLDAGMNTLYGEVPGSEVYADKIKQLLTPQKLLGMFFEDDGVTLKSGAPKKAWLLSEMDTFLSAGMKRMERDVRDAATRDFLRRTPERRATASRSMPGHAGDKQGIDAAREAVRRQLGL